MSNPTPKQRLDALEASAKLGHLHMGQVLMETCRILVDAQEEQNALLRSIDARLPPPPAGPAPFVDQEQRQQIQRLLIDLGEGAQGIRIQQSQLLRDSTWDKERYGKAADEHWARFNRAHKELWALLLGGEAS